MTREEFENLEVGNRVCSIRNPNLILNVVEIATDAKSLQHWINRGHPADLKRIIKLEADKIPDQFCYHTWVGNWEHWSISNES